MSSYSWLIANSAPNSTVEVYNYTYGVDVTFSKSIRADSIKVKIQSLQTGATVSPRIYSSSGVLIATGPAITAAGIFTGWNNFPLSNPVMLTADTTYRICFYVSYSQTVTFGCYAEYASTSLITSGVTMTLMPPPGLPDSGMSYNWKGAGDVYPNVNMYKNTTYMLSMGIGADDIAPNTPTNCSPAGTSSSPSIQSTLTPSLSWSFTDPETADTQRAYQVIIKKASDNSIVKDTGKVISAANIYAIPTGTLQSGTLYYWTVSVWDSADVKNSTSPTAQYIRTISQPTISGSANEALGNKNVPFAITYSVNDADSADSLNVVEKLNGNQINSLSNAPRNTNFTINITKEILNSLPLNQQSTILIGVTDGTTTTYKTITFTRTNSGPQISNSNTDLGIVSNVTQKYTCHDVEGNTFSIIEKVDNVEIKTFAGVDGTEYTTDIPKSIWFNLVNGVHTYTITATDSLGANVVRTFTFTKKETVIESTGLTNVIPTDAAATKIILTPSWSGKENADIVIEVCNNAFDVAPTWENATSQTLLNKPYVFTNTTKTATKWGIDIRFKLSLKAGITDNVELYGLGGAFE